MTENAEKQRLSTGFEAAVRPPVSLTVPCQPEFVALGRLVVGALGGREALDEEIIADLKVIVTEAFTCFLEGADDGAPERASIADGSARSLRLDFAVAAGSWEITISDPEHSRRILPSPVCEPLGDSGLGLTILCALADSVEQIDDDSRGTVLRLVKNLSPEDLGAD